MKKAKNLHLTYFILGIIVISIIGIFFLVPTTNLEEEKINRLLSDGYFYENNLKTADNGIEPLNYSSIFQNVTSLNRLFDSIYFKVNVSGFNDVNYSIMQISYQNNVFKNFSMNVLNNDEFDYVYTPEYDAPLGFHLVNFYLFNQTDYLLNAHTTYINFTITSNYVTKVNKPEFRRNEFLEGELIIIDYDLHTFTWDLSVVDDLNESLETNLFNLGTDQDSFYFELNGSFTASNSTYYVKITITDTFYSKIDRVYIPFMLLNSLPEVVAGSVNFSNTTIKRDEDCTVSLNITDEDRGFDTFVENMSVSIIIQDSTGVKATPISMINNGDWTFEYTFSISTIKPIGTYQVIFDVSDQFYTSSEAYIETIIVENNLPEIYGFTINDIVIEESISINYGEDIVFAFNVSDVEDTISFVTVHLLNERNEWFNISIEYSNNIQLVVRTIDLISGSWLIYITVCDIDGGVTSLTSDYGSAPKEIRIIPDLLSPIIPWLTLIMGIIFGFLVGLAFTYRYLKSKYSGPQESLPKKKKQVKQKVKEPSKRKEEKVTEREEETKKEPSEQKPVQRKIKRRLK